MDKQQKRKKKPKSPAKIGFGVLTVVMLVTVLSTLGTQLRAPWPLNMQIDNPTAIGVADNNGAVIDKDGQRLSYIESSGSLDFINEIDAAGSSGESYTSVAFWGDGFYFTTSKSFDDSSYKASEQVYFCENPNATPQLVYNRNYLATQRLFDNAFFKLCPSVDGNDMLLICKNAEGDRLEAISLRTNCGKTLESWDWTESMDAASSVSINSNYDMCAITTQSGKLYTVNINGDINQINLSALNYFSGSVWDARGMLYTIDNISGALICLDPNDTSHFVQTEGTRYSCIAIDAQHEHILCGTEKGITFYNASDFSTDFQTAPAPFKVINEPIPYSFGITTWTLARWIAIGYLFVIVVLLLIRLVRKMLLEGKKSTLLHAILICAALLAVIAVAVLCLNQFYSFSVNNHKNSVAAICDNVVEDMQQSGLAEKIAGTSLDFEHNEEVQNDINAFGEFLYSKSTAYADHNISTTIMGMVANGSSMVLLAADASGYSLKSIASANETENSRSLYDKVNSAKDSAAIAPLEESGGRQSVVTYRAIVSSNNEILGFLAIYSDVTDLAVSYRNMWINLAISLAALAAPLVFIALEIKAALSARIMARKEKKRREGHPEAWATRQLNFWTAMASGLDATIITLVAKSMLEAQGLTDAAIALSGFPAMSAGIGAFIGMAFAGSLFKHTAFRKIAVFGILGAIVFFMLCAICVSVNDFWLFCLCRAAVNFFIALPWAVIGALPLRIDTEKIRSKLFSDYSMSSISGIAIGGIISGYVSDYIGNAAIYLACIVPALVALMMCLFILPRGAVFDRKQTSGKEDDANKKNGKTGQLKLFLTPAMLCMVVGLTFPALLCNGYKSVLFPLYMSDMGFSNVYINNIVVFSNVFIFIFSPQISHTIKGLNQWKILVYSMLLTAATMMWFKVNSSLVWAILALVVVGISLRVSEPVMMVLMARIAKIKNASQVQANNTHNIVQSLESSIRSPILSALSVLGQSAACFIVGAISAVGVGLFILVTAKSPIRKDDHLGAQNDKTEQRT